MQNKQTKTNNKAVANKQAKKAQATEQAQVRLEDKVLEMLDKAQKADKLIKVQKVTGYTSVKYGNKVLFELHLKRKSITHLTFSNKQKVFEILKANKLIMRVVANSYGWKYNTECLLTEQFMQHFDAILQNVIAEAIEERNLKAKATKKAVKTA